MFGKTAVVLISGRAGVGKSTSAKYLLDLALGKNLKAMVGSFAFGVKDTAKLCFGWNGVKDEKGRKLLQEIGGIGREYNPSIWVDQLFNHYVVSKIGYPFDMIIIDDWRFPNEAEFIQNDPLYSVCKVRIVSPEREVLKGQPTYNDISEVSLLDTDEYDYLIYNDGDLLDLQNMLTIMFEMIYEKYNTYGVGEQA